ncbi:MAG TPA: DUF3800 domain-containing protein [Candidatus Acidoferrum sp.]
MTIIESIPCPELFQAFAGRDFRKRNFAMLIGHIDDSGDDKTRLFTLSCLVTSGGIWGRFEHDWKHCLKKKNKELKKQGRKQISRFHATDFNFSYGDFIGWDSSERKDFSERLIKIFAEYNVAIFSYTISLRELQEVIPESAKNPVGLAHILCLNKIMIEIGSTIFAQRNYAKEKLIFLHDRGNYDAVLLEAFHFMKDDKLFEFRDHFVSIAPMCWKDCILLQPADMIAYENFKIIERKEGGHASRTSMDLILNLESIGGVGKKITKVGLEYINGKLGEEARQILYENARIRQFSKGYRHLVTSSPCRDESET